MDEFAKKVNDKREEIIKKYINEDIDLIDKKTIIKDYIFLLAPILPFEHPKWCILSYKKNCPTKVSLKELEKRCEKNDITYNEIFLMNNEEKLSEQDSRYLESILYFYQIKKEFKNENNINIREL